MSKLIEPSVSDSFNAPRTPPDPNKTNWKSILLQVCLHGVVSGILLYIANRSSNNKIHAIQNGLGELRKYDEEVIKSVQKLTSSKEEKASAGLETELNDKV